MLALVAVALLMFLVVRPASAQVTLTGGSNTILGIYFSIGSILTLAPWTTLTLGATYTSILNTEPLISFRFARPLRGWTLTFNTTLGGLVGDYRVDRLPEIRLTRQAPLGAHLSYSLDFGLGNFRVWPGNLAAIRADVGMQVSTLPITLSRSLSAGALIGYRQYMYFNPAQARHSAWWTSAYVSWRPLPTVAATLSYFRQEIWGASPLLFDAMGRDQYVTGTLSVRPTPRITLTHTQTYSFVSRAISARVYGGQIALRDGQSVVVSWDDVPRTFSLSYGRSGFGALGVSWTIPTNVWAITFSR